MNTAAARRPALRALAAMRAALSTKKGGGSCA